jgi:BirA family transcriptional regulator, biotin operon repressor / biotin---[acetyl-CoA-carboxylase] ligase
MNRMPTWVRDLQKSRQGERLGREVVYFESTDSTNRQAREKALGGGEEGLVVIADSQSQGKGRMGRSWSSPPGSNVYFSTILRPSIPPIQAPQITLIAGISCAQALTRATGLDVRIKWPNDIFLNGKKVAGILAEMDGERSDLRFVILGIGINVNWAGEDIPEPLREIATSLRAESGEAFDRASILSEVLEELERNYTLFLAEGFSGRMRDEWNRLSGSKEKWATVCFPDKKISGKILGLDTDGALLLLDGEGKTHRFIAGDVSLRV